MKTILAALLVALPLTLAAKEVNTDCQIWDIRRTVHYHLSPDQMAQPESPFSTARMAETDNFAFFWEHSDSLPIPQRVDLDSLGREAERIYAYFADTLGFATPLLERYKVNVFIFDHDRGPLYGGSDGVTGAMWVYPDWFARAGGFAGFAHELGHSFQSAVADDNGGGLHGPVAEMTSQYMLWRFYPAWPDFEAYHPEAYVRATHLPLMDPGNMYHSPFMLEYWAQLHGPQVMAELWRHGHGSNDAIATYKSLYRLNDKQLADRTFEAVTHFVTWDIDRGATMHNFVGRSVTPMDTLAGAALTPVEVCRPGAYGYNVIELPSDGRLELTFDGDGKADNWRYGIVTLTTDGRTIHSPAYTGRKRKVKHTVPSDAQSSWLVVMPTRDGLSYRLHIRPL